MTETVFYRWLPIIQAWVREFNHFDMRPEGSRGVIRTPFFMGHAMMEGWNPLIALAAYRTNRRIADDREAVRILELDGEFVRRLIHAIYSNRPPLETRYRILREILPQPSTDNQV